MHFADGLAGVWVFGALALFAIGTRRARAVRLAAFGSALVLLGLASLWFLAVRPPIARHDRQALQLQRDLTELIRESVPDARIVGSDRTVENRAPAGGYCSFYVTMTVRTATEPPEVEALLDGAIERHGPDWMLVTATSGGSGVVLVEAERMGEGGTIDPRCG